jgi:hypothetical protein
LRSLPPLELISRGEPIAQGYGSWSKHTRLHLVQFEWEDEPQLREVRLSNVSVQVGDAVRVAVGGVEVEGRIEAVESSTLHVRIGRRLF